MDVSWFNGFENPPIVVRTSRFPDKRGSFGEIYNDKKYHFCNQNEWSQVNHSISRKRTIRGLHFRKGEAKLLTVISGQILDVVVDISPESKTFGKHISVTLSPGHQIYIPDGWAHGFETISSEGSHVIYMTNKIWDPKMSKAIAWNDKTLAIKWKTQHPILSQQDSFNPTFEEWRLNNG